MRFLRDAGGRVETLILQKENDALGGTFDARGRSDAGGKERRTHSRTDAGGHTLKHISAIDHFLISLERKSLR